MLLRPRRFNHKGIFKRRRVWGSKLRFKPLVFGTSALILTQNTILTSQKMFRIKLILKKSARRADKTSRKLWFNAFPHLPLSKKIVGARMGKGKGKLNSWFTLVKSGVALFEVKNLREGRFNYFSKQIKSKLGAECLIIHRYSGLSNTNYNISNKAETSKFTPFK